MAELWPRQKTCVQCPNAAPKCLLDCGTNTECQISTPKLDPGDPNCFLECSKAFCGAIVSTPPPTGNTNAPGGNSGASVGPIAGGVAGGVVAIAIATYLVWRFCIKGKRQAIDQDGWNSEKDAATISGNSDFVARRDQRSSSHTVHSVASTVLTRASNVIQIAYIPGVTNRATPTSPTLLVPPVPPIPISHSQASSPVATEDQHFFMPSDLRPDSTYSAMSGYTDRTSFARTSYAPRSSIASTIYGKNAVIVAPAQTGMRAKPAMVSVKSTMSSGSSGSSTPPVPNIDFEKYSASAAGPPSPANSTFSVGSTFLNNASASTAMAARPNIVRVGSVSSKKPGSSLANSVSAGDSPVASPLVTSPVSPSESRVSAAVTLIEDSPHPDQGPFADPPKSQNDKSKQSLNAVIEEATRRASQRYVGCRICCLNFLVFTYSMAPRHGTLPLPCRRGLEMT
ncbi:hypothetical protein RB601_009192 [Gaeumannomyces tritici]